MSSIRYAKVAVERKEMIFSQKGFHFLVTRPLSAGVTGLPAAVIFWVLRNF